MLTSRLSHLMHRWQDDPDQLSLLDLAVLTYARWQGLTNETAANRQAAKAVLDTLLLDLDSDDLHGLRDHAATLGERHLRDFLRTSMEVLAEDLKAQAREIAMTPDWDVASDAAGPPDPSPLPALKRPRDKDR